MRGDWDFFKARLNDADAGELRDGGSYLIDGWHGWPVTFPHNHAQQWLDTWYMISGAVWQYKMVIPKMVQATGV